MEPPSRKKMMRDSAKLFAVMIAANFLGTTLALTLFPLDFIRTLHHWLFYMIFG